MAAVERCCVCHAQASSVIATESDGPGIWIRNCKCMGDCECGAPIWCPNCAARRQIVGIAESVVQTPDGPLVTVRVGSDPLHGDLVAARFERDAAREHVGRLRVMVTHLEAQADALRAELAATQAQQAPLQRALREHQERARQAVEILTTKETP